MQPIFFAEDSEDDLFLLQRAFRRMQVTNPLVVVRDGGEAVNVLSTKDQQGIGCIILDIKMPIRGGLDVLGWLREQPAWNDTPVLMMTSSSQAQDVRDAYRLGADGYLVKPSGSGELDHLVKQLSGAVGRPRTDPVWRALPSNLPPPPLTPPDKRP